MKPIKNFQKLCDVLSVFNLNGEKCRFQMYDTTEFWIEPLRKDSQNANIYPVVFRPDWANEMIRMRVISDTRIPDMIYPIPPLVRGNPQDWVTWIFDLVSSQQDKVYKRQII